MDSITETIQQTGFTADATKSLILIPGRRYSLMVSGNFGGGTVTPTQSFTGGSISGSCAMTAITAVGMSNFIAAANTLTFVMAGSGGIYQTTLTLVLCPVGV